MSIFKPRSATTKTLADIDLDEPKRQLAEIAAERAKVEGAIADAERQRDEASAEIGRRRTRDPVDGRRVADALLAGDVIEDAEPIEALQQRLDAMRGGIGDLNRRLRELDQRRAEVRSALVAELAEAAAPLADRLAERASAAIGQLVSVLADAQAIRSASQNSAAYEVVYRLDDHVERLASKFQVAGWRDQPPATEIVRAFAPAAEAVALARLTMPG